MNGKSVFALFPIVVLCVATASVHAQTGPSSPNGDGTRRGRSA